MRRASDDLEYRKTAEGHAAYKFQTMLANTQSRDGADRGAEDTAGEWPAEWGSHLADDVDLDTDETMHSLKCADCAAFARFLVDYLSAAGQGVSAITGRPLTWGGTDFADCRAASTERGLNSGGYQGKLERGNIAGLRYVRSHSIPGRTFTKADVLCVADRKAVPVRGPSAMDQREARGGAGAAAAVRDGGRGGRARLDDREHAALRTARFGPAEPAARSAGDSIEQRQKTFIWPVSSLPLTIHRNLQSLPARILLCCRGEKGRDLAGEFNIDMEDLLQEVEKYRLRCFWLKIPMCLVSGGDWFFSLERKDPFKVRILRSIRF